METNILDEIRNSGFSLTRLTDHYPELSALKNVSQNPKYHAEGDAYCHTKLVCQKLTALPEWRDLNLEEQEILFLAAAFHDIGKPVCTRLEDGEWVSPRHTIIGEKVFRGIAYWEAERFGLTFAQRELVAKLIRYHGTPVWFWTAQRPEFNLLKAAESIPLRLLYLLSKADIQGRIISETLPDPLIDHVELFADYARELGIWEKPYAFANAHTRFQYFHKSDLRCGARLYDDTEFDVILMSGLPLSGKDTWVGKNGAATPVISLDNIRRELKILPTKGSDKVAHVATERARCFLRKKQPFIWNATNITEETRQRLVTLFAGYGARVYIMYLEVPCQELHIRNQKRARYIPEPALKEMIRKLEVPAPWEAREVKYLL